MTSKRRLMVMALAAVVAVSAAVLVVRIVGSDPTRLQAAVSLAPEGSERLLWTDWAGVRDELDADLSADSPREQVEGFLDDGFAADLTSTSAMLDSTPTLHQKYGVSPANLDWELLAQGEDGQLVMMGLPDDLDLDSLRDRLRSLGYLEPSGEESIWQIDLTEFTRLGEVAPEFRFLQLDAEHRALVASEDPAYLRDWQDRSRGTGHEDGIAEVTDAMAEAVSAVVYSGDHACGALAMHQADSADAARGAQLLAEAGEVHPMRGYAMAALPGGEAEVVMAFESADHARTDADTRSQLAAGPAPGQGGDFTDRFTLGEVTADGTIVRMALEPADGAYVISDLSSGPVLFATC